MRSLISNFTKKMYFVKKWRLHLNDNLQTLITIVAFLLLLLSKTDIQRKPLNVITFSNDPFTKDY